MKTFQNPKYYLIASKIWGLPYFFPGCVSGEITKQSRDFTPTFK